MHKINQRLDFSFGLDKIAHNKLLVTNQKIHCLTKIMNVSDTVKNPLPEKNFQAAEHTEGKV